MWKNDSRSTCRRSREGAVYRTLDDQTLLNAALDDPHGFVAHGDNLMIIDEVQRAPTLLMAVKKDVDETKYLAVLSLRVRQTYNPCRK